MHQLLAYCARLDGDPAYYHQLAEQVNGGADWPGIITAAEAHGLGPLLYTHLRAADVALPPQIKQELQGLYLRHRLANRIRTEVLADILAAYQQAGIEAVVLKGAALAHQLYPEPGLRSMRDLDLLVKKADARQAQSILAELGFHAPLPAANRPLPGKHLAAATRRINDLLISVEVHHNLFNAGTPASLTFDDLSKPLLTFPLAELAAYTLSYEEMLWHLCQHLKLIAQPFRLIWLVDIVGLAERFVAKIDWERIERRYPLVLRTLALFHYITPLSPRLRQTASLTIGRVPHGVGVEFTGWPRTSIRHQRATNKGYYQMMVDTFFPSEWWLRLYYELGSDRPVFWTRWVQHPLRILGWSAQLILKQLKKFRA